MSPHCSCFHGPSHCGSRRRVEEGGGGGGRGEERRGEERRGEERREERRGEERRGEERRGREKEREGDREREGERGREREGGRERGREREGEGGRGREKGEEDENSRREGGEEGWWEGKLKQSLCAELETTVMRVEHSEHSKQCRPNQTLPPHCVVLKVIFGLSITAPCSQTYHYLRASPSNKLQTYLKEPLKDQQTVLHFRRVGHLYPVPERSDLFAGYNATAQTEPSASQWTGIFGMRKLFPDSFPYWAASFSGWQTFDSGTGL